MIKGYWKTQGKIPIGKEVDRKLYQEPPNGDYCAVYEEGTTVSIDIDDYNHKSGELENPIRGQARSKAVIEYLDEHQYKYNGIKTENGTHLDFKVSKDFPIEANKNGWFCALGLEIEVKVTKVVELVVVNDIKRTCFKGSFDNDDIDELPPALYPIQKSKETPFSMNFEAGNRNSHLSEYAFHLSQIGIFADEIKKIICGMNRYVLEDPLSEEEIELILRPETLDKLKQVERERQEKNLSQVQVGQEVIDHFNPITCDGVIYGWKNGVYVPLAEEVIGSFIRKKHPSIKTSLKKEVLDYLTDVTYRGVIREAGNLINVQNGLLQVGSNGQVVLIPHTKDYISFRQLNAAYNSEARSQVLQDTLNKFFDDDNEQIELFKQILGYLLMNHTDYQKCFFFVGSPSSGKSKILNMITAFCGKGNVSNLTLKELDDRFRTANIVGKIANINADLEKAKVLVSGNFKALVTGDAITLEKKYSKPFSHTNTAKLIFASNQHPDFSRDSEGIQRRVIIIPCNHIFRKTDKDFNPRIDEELCTEEARSSLLNMAIEGYISLIENGGFITTKASKEAGEMFEMEMNNVRQWLNESEGIEERLEHESIKGLYLDYCSFCHGIGEEPRIQREFTKTIRSEYHMEAYLKRVGKDRVRAFRKKR